MMWTAPYGNGNGKENGRPMGLNLQRREVVLGTQARNFVVGDERFISMSVDREPSRTIGRSYGAEKGLEKCQK
jgi:hypothetical protein